LFEEYDLPGLNTANGIADIDGNYPSKDSSRQQGGFQRM
jgi:hypothetical protein